MFLGKKIIIFVLELVWNELCNSFKGFELLLFRVCNLVIYKIYFGYFFWFFWGKKKNCGKMRLKIIFVYLGVKGEIFLLGNI